MSKLVSTATACLVLGCGSAMSADWSPAKAQNLVQRSVPDECVFVLDYDPPREECRRADGSLYVPQRMPLAPGRAASPRGPASFALPNLPSRSEEEIVRINGLHRNAYRSDADYRTQIDAVIQRSDRSVEAADRNARAFDAWVRARRLVTPYDRDVEIAEHRARRARASGDFQEVLFWRQRGAILQQARMDFLEGRSDELRRAIRQFRNGPRIGS